MDVNIVRYTMRDSIVATQLKYYLHKKFVFHKEDIAIHAREILCTRLAFTAMKIYKLIIEDRVMRTFFFYGSAQYDPMLGIINVSEINQTGYSSATLWRLMSTC